MYSKPAPPQAGDKRHAPATVRNRAAILAALRGHLPAGGTVLEVASGSGEHACHFAAALAPLRWQPTDTDPAALRSIEAWRAEVDSPGPLPARHLDCLAANWPVQDLSDLAAVVAINLLHISPWSVTGALFNQAAAILPATGVVFVYGPFRRGDDFISAGNRAFAATLRGQDPAWGLRDVDAVVAVAETAGWRPRATLTMPANNLSLVFGR